LKLPSERDRLGCVFRRTGFDLGIGLGANGRGWTSSGNRAAAEGIDHRPASGRNLDGLGVGVRHLDGDGGLFPVHDLTGDLPRFGVRLQPRDVVGDGAGGRDGDGPRDRHVVRDDVRDELTSWNLIGSEGHPRGVGPAIHGAGETGTRVVLAGGDFGNRLVVGLPVTAVLRDLLALGALLIRDAGDFRRAGFVDSAVRGDLAVFHDGPDDGLLDDAFFIAIGGDLHLSLFHRGDLLHAGLAWIGHHRDGRGTGVARVVELGLRGGGQRQ
jgi:hypothetical protein